MFPAIYYSFTFTFKDGDRIPCVVTAHVGEMWLKDESTKKSISKFGIIAKRPDQMLCGYCNKFKQSDVIMFMPDGTNKCWDCCPEIMESIPAMDNIGVI